MTPSERAQAEAEFYAEFREKMHDCALLEQRIKDAANTLAALAKDIRLKRPLGDIAQRLSVDELVAALEDYRSTRARCESLHQALTRYGPNAGITPVDFPPY